jgi:hypothetical protein
MSDEIARILDEAEASLNAAMKAIQLARRESSDPNVRVSLGMTKLRKDRRAAGQCANCGDPNSSKYHCQKCRRKINAA